MKPADKNGPKEVKRDQKAQENLQKKQEAARAALPAIKTALSKYGRPSAKV